MTKKKFKQLWNLLPPEVQYDIEMTSYAEYNDKIARLYDNESDPRDIKDLEDAEYSLEKDLMLKYLEKEIERYPLWVQLDIDKELKRD